MRIPEIVTLPKICRNFPQLEEPAIQRENLIDTIDIILESKTDVAIVEGQDGIGKTTLLAQFALRHPTNAVSLFLRPTRWGYDPLMVRFDLCNQFHWILHQEELRDLDRADEGTLRTLILSLQRRASRENSPYYLIVDGLAEIPPQDEELRKMILEMLPFGLHGFRCVVSGNIEELSRHLPPKVSRKPYPLTGFTLDETNHFLSDCPVGQQQIQELHKISRGIPGNLASIRRLLRQGLDAEELLENISSKLPDLFELEWKKLSSESEEKVISLALVAFDKRPRTVEEIASIAAIDKDDLELLLRDQSFIEIDSRTGQVGYISEAFRTFAAQRLAHLRSKSHELLIGYLTERPITSDALVSLPDYLEQVGRLGDLVGYLSPENFIQVIQQTQSLQLAKQKASQGLRAAHSLRRDGDLMRFALQRSVVSDFPGATFVRSEVEARMALRDYASALSIAQAAMVREDRLQLLCTYARVSRLQGIEPDKALLDNIRYLLEQVDAETLGEKAIDIAKDLLFVLPETALELVERATRTDSKENALDIALTSLSLAALRFKSSSNSPVMQLEAAERAQDRINNPSARSILSAMAIFVGDFSSTEVIAQTEKLSRVVDKVQFLAKWLLRNATRQDSLKIIDHALSLIIANAAYSPNAAAFRDLAAPLRYQQNAVEVRRLIGIFDGQRGNLERIGPTADYIELQLILAAAYGRFDFNGGCSRILDVYFQTAELADPITRLSCLAKLLAILEEVDSEGILEAKEGLRALTESELIAGIGQLLGESADHFRVTKNILIALVPTRLDLAEKIAARLNQERYRNLAYIEIVESAIRQPLDKLDLQGIWHLSQSISDHRLKNESLLLMIERIEEEEHISDATAGVLCDLLNNIETITSANARTEACCLALVCLKKLVANHPLAGRKAYFLQLLRSSWESIDRAWEKIDAGFTVVKRLAEEEPEVADLFLRDTYDLRKDVGLDTAAVINGLGACISLAIRAFAGIVAAKLDSDDDLEHIYSLINLVPSAGDRAFLFSDLALRFFQNRRFGECTQIVTERVKPLVSQLSSGDLAYRNAVVLAVAPALYAAHRSTGISEILSLPPRDRDYACASIARMIFTKLPPTEPYEFRYNTSFQLTYEDIIDACDILEYMETDREIQPIASRILVSMAAKPNRNRYTEQQKAEIFRRLDHIIEEKLPDVRNISHNGYKILLRAEIARTKRASTHRWSVLTAEATSLSNTADRAFVLAHIGIMALGRDRDMSKDIISFAIQSISQLPSAIDRIDRYELMARLAMDDDASLSRRCLQLAMDEVRSRKEEDFTAYIKRIINTAHSIDPTLASSLASLLDDDPARAVIRKEIREHLEILNAKKHMLNASPQDSQGDRRKTSYTSEVAWRMLSSLNSTRASSLPMSRIRDYVLSSMEVDLSISTGYDFFSWIIENISRSYHGTAEARIYLRPAFEAALLSAELSARIAAGNSKKLQRLREVDFGDSSASSVLVRAGERSSAVRFIKDWLSSNSAKYLKICDPYFGPDDLEILKIIMGINPSCRVSILTSRKHHVDEKIALPWEETYRLSWQRISEQEPPPTDLVIIGLEHTGASPVHDRWWLSETGGLRLGTSYGSLGRQRNSDISILSRLEAEIREREIDQYLDRIKREHQQKRLNYFLFSL